MIRAFADKEAKRVYLGRRSPRLPGDIQARAHRKLIMIDQAQTLQDLKSPPSNRLEVLKGDRTGRFSIRINDQWRICFTWSEGGADAVEIVDYH